MFAEILKWSWISCRSGSNWWTQFSHRTFPCTTHFISFCKIFCTCWTFQLDIPPKHLIKQSSHALSRSFLTPSWFQASDSWALKYKTPLFISSDIQENMHVLHYFNGFWTWLLITTITLINDYLQSRQKLCWFFIVHNTSHIYNDWEIVRSTVSPTLRRMSLSPYFFPRQLIFSSENRLSWLLNETSHP